MTTTLCTRKPTVTIDYVSNTVTLRGGSHSLDTMTRSSFDRLWRWIEQPCVGYTKAEDGSSITFYVKEAHYARRGFGWGNRRLEYVGTW